MRFSTFSHVLNRGDRYCFYNALNMNTFFVSKSEYEEVLKQVAAGEKNKPLIEQLYSAKILVDNEFSEADHLDRINKLVFDGVQVRVMVLHLTDYCNLRCKYCFIEGNIGEDYCRESMTTEVVTSAIEKFVQVLKDYKKPANPSIVFYGGEPLANWNTMEYALEYLEKYAYLNIDKILITNGTLLDEIIAKKLKKFGVHVSVSLDGDEKHTNINRQFVSGEGAFAKTIHGIELLRAAGIEPSVSCVLSKENVENATDIIDYFANQLQIKALGFNHVSIVKGHAAPKEDSRTPLCLLYGIDCSGSMGEETRIINENGESVFIPKIQQANEGFAMCAKSINRFAKENTRFLPKWQVIELNTYSKPVFPSFVTVHDHSLSESQFSAGGSTNIEAWINNVLQFLNKKHLGNYNRAVNIILLSDGVPTDIDGWALSPEAYKKIVDKFKAYLDEHDFSRNVEFYFIAVGDDAEPFGRYFAGDDHFFKVEDCESIADKLDFVTRQTLADSTTVATNPIDFSNDEEDEDEELSDTDSDYDEDEDDESNSEEDEDDTDDDEEIIDSNADEEFGEEDEEDEDEIESDDTEDDDGEGDGSLDDILKF